MISFTVYAAQATGGLLSGRKAEKASFSSPIITMISTIHGKPIPSGAVPTDNYLRRHIRQAVRFDSSIRSLAEG